MNYLRILMAAAGEIWALEPEKMEVVVQFLVLKAQGGNVADEDLVRITQKQEREVARSQGAVGVIPVYGMIGQRMNMMSDISGGTSTEAVAKHFRTMLADDAVKAIIFDVDSPGGTSSGIEELATEILQSRGRKPIVAQVNALAASAAYWIASAADEVVSTPSGRGGSVGVYTIHNDISKALEMAGVKRTAISAGAHKTEGMSHIPLSEETMERLQTRVGLVNDKFERALAVGRNVSQATVRRDFGQGAVFLAEEMLERKMIDRIATLPQTLERFGVDLNPVASRTRSTAGARAEATQVLVDKLKAGDPSLTQRELERGLEGLIGLSGSEAARAASVCFKNPGDPEPAAQPDDAAIAAAWRNLQATLAGIKIGATKS